MKRYVATKSRSQGRSSYAVIFRHPVRQDPLHPGSGRRIRRGLGTSDAAEADRLVSQLNELLADERFWNASARSAAESRFDSLVVDIFFDSMDPEIPDPIALRDAALPLPTRDDGYRQVLLLGTTGAGKTTVVRQLLGTHPTRERFPSTSTAKTTVADTELILRDGDDFEAVVTFVPRDQLADYLAENMSEAALAALRKRPDAEITRKLLDHVNQRFRFSYVLGRPAVDDEDLDDEDLGIEEYEELPEGDIDVEESVKVVAESVARLKELVADFERTGRTDLAADEDDERVVQELLEEQLDAEVRSSERFRAVEDELFGQIELRFGLLVRGSVTRSRQGWPTTWRFTSTDRAEFLAAVARFSSNDARQFGRLLTPLVNGIRVAGPFRPAWAESTPRLVLIDGEGLGHTPTSMSTLSTPVMRRVELVDAVLLVDNAANPVQAAPTSAMKALATSGNGAKLFMAFTHFDQVKGDNIPTFDEREQHVLASLDNVLRSIGDELGPFAERSLRQRRDRATFFLAGMQDVLNEQRKGSRRTIEQLRRMQYQLEAAGQKEGLGDSRPVYHGMELYGAVAGATATFHNKWKALLGLEYDPTFPKEHWTRVKALSRRLAEGWQDEYGDLKPIADLRKALQDQIYLMLQRPMEWSGETPTDDEQLVVIDALSNAVLQRIMEISERRLKDEVRSGWVEAFDQRGSGSTFVRARIIAEDVYERGAPAPTLAASPHGNDLLHEVAAAVADVAAAMGAVLR